MPGNKNSGRKPLPELKGRVKFSGMIRRDLKSFLENERRDKRHTYTDILEMMLENRYKKGK